MARLTPTATRWLTAALAGALLLSSVAFALPPAGGDDLRPVPFDDTVSAGGTGVDLRRSEAEGFAVPRAEVFFSNYRYVVGYYGVETAAATLADPATERQFGAPLAVYVSDFSTVTPTLSEQGFVVPERGRAVGWVAADEAAFVVDSGARVPSGPAVLPFTDRADADRFAAAHGGDVVDWAALQRRADDPLASRLDRLRGAAATRRAWANDTVAASRALLDRPRSVVVGEDAPNVAAAVAAAPPNTTVYLPPGRYETTGLVVDEPVTIAGAGNETVLSGGGNGSVVHARADRVAVRDLRIEGVGDVGSRGPERRNASADWDTRVQLAYGYGDAGVVLDGSNGSVVSNVAVETPASGVVVRESDRSVVDGVTVRGASTPREGFMGTVLVGGRSVVQDSTFVDGRDGVYTHRADGSVIRRNRMTGGRFGVHEMYTSRTLVADNVARAVQTGVMVMTRPTGNVVVGNDVRDSAFGIVPAGGNSLYADNVVASNRYGFQVAGDGNAFVDNVAAGNDVGVRANEIRPANWVVRNDVVDNERRVEATLGPLRTWSHGGAGNYWGDLPLTDADGDGVYDRAYQPTGPVDGRLDEAPGPTLARSPAAATLRRVRDATTGLRRSGVLDAAPRTEPFHPERVADARTNATGGVAA